jgi:hypothetical protein
MQSRHNVPQLALLAKIMSDTTSSAVMWCAAVPLLCCCPCAVQWHMQCRHMHHPGKWYCCARCVAMSWEYTPAAAGVTECWPCFVTTAFGAHPQKIAVVIAVVQSPHRGWQLCNYLGLAEYHLHGLCLDQTHTKLRLIPVQVPRECEPGQDADIILCCHLTCRIALYLHGSGKSSAYCRSQPAQGDTYYAGSSVGHAVLLPTNS